MLSIEMRRSHGGFRQRRLLEFAGHDGEDTKRVDHLMSN